MAVLKVRKKPIVVEAVFFYSGNYDELDKFTQGNFRLVDPEDRSDDPEIVAEVWDKLHNTWVGVKDEQVIIKGIQGEFYPCDADVFSATYERVE